MAVTQSHYRFGIDELAESTHGWYAAEDTNPNFGVIPVDTTFLLRFTLQCDGTLQSNVDPNFEYRKNGGTWTQITTGTTNVKAVTPTCWANAANTTKRLSGSGTFIGATGCTTDGIAGGTAFDIPASGNGETECALQLVGANLVAGDLIEFRLTRDAQVLIDTYSVTPALGIPLSTAPTESIRTFDLVLGVAAFVTGAAIAAGMPWEVMKISDTVQAQLDPPSNLSIQLEESVRVRDFVFGASRGVPTAMLSVGLMETVFHLSDDPPIYGIIATPPAENIKIQASGLVELIGIGNAIKITDGPVIAALVNANDLAVAVPSEGLKVVDTNLFRTLDPLQTGLLTENLKVVDATPPLASIVDPGLTPSLLTENLKFTASGSVELLEECESLKISDGPVLAALQGAAADLSVTVTAESLKVVDVGEAEISKDEVIKITDGPVQALLVNVGDLSVSGIDESLKVVDQLNVTITPIVASFSENLKVVDAVLGPTLDPEQTSLSENLKVVDVVLGPTIDPEQTSLTENLKVVDQLTVTITPVFATLTDALKVVDVVLGPTLDPEQTGLLTENLKVVDVILGPTLDPEQASASESLKVVDVVLGPTLDPEQATPSEIVKITDGPVQAALGDMFLFVAAENLKVVDVVLGPTLNPFEALLTENLKVVDQTPPTASLGNNLFAFGFDDSLKVIDQVTTSINPEEATVTENLKIVDQLQAALQLAIAIANESLKVVDQATTTLDPLETSLTDSLKVVDQDPVGSSPTTLAANPTESLKVVDQVTTSLNPEQTTIADALSVVDQLQVALQLAVAVTSESLKVVDQAPLALLDPLVVILTDSLKVVDQTPSVADATDLTAILSESLKVVDQTPTGRLNPLQVDVAAESLKVVDQTPTGLLNPLLTGLLIESLKVVDQNPPTVGEGTTLTVTLTESLKVVDSRTVVLDPEETERTESLKITESLTLALTPEEASASESLKVVDQLTVALDHLEVNLTESLKVTESGPRFGGPQIIDVIGWYDTVITIVGEYNSSIDV